MHGDCSRGLDIRFPDFAPLAELAQRSACADIHVVSLRPKWSGTVVPSKFFGALAAGRPVLFYGSEDSSVAEWIRQFQVGWVLHEGNIAPIAAQILDYANSSSAQRRMQARCFGVYRSKFSRATQLAKWRDCMLAQEITQGEQECENSKQFQVEKQETTSSGYTRN